MWGRHKQVGQAQLVTLCVSATLAPRPFPIPQKTPLHRAIISSIQQPGHTSSECSRVQPRKRRAHHSNGCVCLCTRCIHLCSEQPQPRRDSAAAGAALLLGGVVLRRRGCECRSYVVCAAPAILSSSCERRAAYSPLPLSGSFLLIMSTCATSALLLKLRRLLWQGNVQVRLGRRQAVSVSSPDDGASWCRRLGGRRAGRGGGAVGRYGGVLDSAHKKSSSTCNCAHRGQATPLTWLGRTGGAEETRAPDHEAGGGSSTPPLLLVPAAEGPALVTSRPPTRPASAPADAIKSPTSVLIRIPPAVAIATATNEVDVASEPAD